MKYGPEEDLICWQQIAKFVSPLLIEFLATLIFLTTVQNIANLDVIKLKKYITTNIREDIT